MEDPDVPIEVPDERARSWRLSASLPAWLETLSATEAAPAVTRCAADSFVSPYGDSSRLGIGSYSSHWAATRRRRAIMAPAAPAAAPAAISPATIGHLFRFIPGSLRALAAPSRICSYNGANASLVVDSLRLATLRALSYPGVKRSAAPPAAWAAA